MIDSGDFVFITILLYLLCLPSLQQQDQTGAVRKAVLGITKKRPDFSTIQFVKNIDEGYFGLKTPSNGSRSIAELKDKLEKDKLEKDKRGNGKVDEQSLNKEEDLIRIFQNMRPKQVEYVVEYNCNFESECQWAWRKDIANGFFITSGGHIKKNQTGPKLDANEREFGSYLILRLPQKSTEYHVTSPLLGPTTSSCKLNLHVYQENMEGGSIRIVGDKTINYPMNVMMNNHTQWVVNTIQGNNLSTWKKEELSIGKITTNFTIILEVVPAENVLPRATVAFDNIQLYECFVKSDDTCSYHQYRCQGTRDCINATSVCDFIDDCPSGDDEKQNCHLMPYGSRCTFEEDVWCGWSNEDSKDVLQWIRHKGSTPNDLTGPNFDHTYLNTSGHYLFVNMLTEQANFASTAVLKSVVFNPPPRVHGNISSSYYNTCAIRFYVHKTGKHKSALKVQVTEFAFIENKTSSLYWSFMEDHGDQWKRVVLLLPNITHRYSIHFEAKKGYRFISDLAIDDVSLSPECFGINIPEAELQGYNYWNPKTDNMQKDTVDDFKNKTYYKITTCRNTGRYGPSHQNCTKEYNGTSTSVKVLHEAGLSGVQKWTAPRDGYYTLIVAGASGGRGSSGMGSSRGAIVRSVVFLTQGQELLVLAGQEGRGASVKVLGQTNNRSNNSDTKSVLKQILSMTITDSGGGGGGATYVFMRNRTKHSVPIAIAAGGGGLGLGRIFDVESYHGQGFVEGVRPFTGQASGNIFSPAGPGGGWTMSYGNLAAQSTTSGSSLLMGGVGGKACYKSIDGKGDGGFGGGGGGCTNGGGGGGYSGGAANSTNGEGGTSFVDLSRTEARFAKAYSGQNFGPGYVVIIPAIIEGCECDVWCVALDERRSETTCICPKDFKLADDKKSCISGIVNLSHPYPPWFVVGLIVTVFCLTVAFGMVCFVLYNRYQQQVSGLLRHKGCPVSDVQLSRLRHASGSVTTQYNPNYEFGGIITTIADLQHIPRDQLRLVKALGQGAFGEVYQGCYRQRPCDTVEMPVAVKTLQELTVKQAEDDFLTEALIMSKFNHPNIVHFIGVCFDKHPKFIVLELLTGGDLKNFLRESRPKPDRPSVLNMKDLITIAMDIARGCKYLEEKRFIHRDIAARNCLLTTKGPGRVAKIADFGMSRDIYRADYYRKDGKAMLPIKWMPPEAFLEGLFSSKTDVWSFGILLWEIMKMGFMPYTGCSNREVMDLVVRGGRLERPENCPPPIYAIMYSCWLPKPEDRPNFGTLLERLSYCLQDSEVLNAPLPMFYFKANDEKDTTIIRPSDSNDNCLQVITNPSDYLVPNHTAPTTPDTLEQSTSSVEKLIPDNSNEHWETSFSIIPNSRSTQPLLDSENSKEGDTPLTVDELLSMTTATTTAPRTGTSVKAGVSLDASALAKSMCTTPLTGRRYLEEIGGRPFSGNGDAEIDC
ncbi:hypothetical protein ABEB36_001900 [Hypothenemus hampei]|uniref:Tyrosine-protein kinase receptor n=1 Tax=Hypothenemus hampei TaxID=57062 RepID=A0ABD1FGR9_HYPHA